MTVKLRIAAHRGLWSGDEKEGVPVVAKNSAAAFRFAAQYDFGLETDFRDVLGRIVISHNPPAEDALPIEEFAKLLTPGQIVLVNIKADGIAPALKKAAAATPFGACRLFAFDMSVPDTLDYVRTGFPFLERVSEYEPLDRSPEGFFPGRAGFWLDGFHSDWWDEELLRSLVRRFRTVAVVSPELHGRPHAAAWSRIQSVLGRPDPETPEGAEIILCTDIPFEARRRLDVFD